MTAYQLKSIQQMSFQKTRNKDERMTALKIKTLHLRFQGTGNELEGWTTERALAETKIAILQNEKDFEATLLDDYTGEEYPRYNKDDLQKERVELEALKQELETEIASRPILPTKSAPELVAANPAHASGDSLQGGGTFMTEIEVMMGQGESAPELEPSGPTIEPETLGKLVWKGTRSDFERVYDALKAQVKIEPSPSGFASHFVDVHGKPMLSPTGGNYTLGESRDPKTRAVVGVIRKLPPNPEC